MLKVLLIYFLVYHKKYFDYRVITCYNMLDPLISTCVFFFFFFLFCFVLFFCCCFFVCVCFVVVVVLSLKLKFSSGLSD